MSILVARAGWEAADHPIPEALLYGLVLAVVLSITWKQIIIGVTEITRIQETEPKKLNAEQCRHLAVTLRTIGIGALIPLGLKIYGYGSTIPTWIVVIWVSIAIWLEILAVRILGNNQDETEE